MSGSIKMNAVMFIMLSMFDVATLSNDYGLSDTYLIMQCEMHNDRFNYCSDLGDAIDPDNISNNNYPSIIEIPIK